MIRISDISFFRFCLKNGQLDWPKCSRTLKTHLQIISFQLFIRISCEQRFLSCMSLSIYEVIGLPQGIFCTTYTAFRFFCKFFVWLTWLAGLHCVLTLPDVAFCESVSLKRRLRTTIVFTMPTTTKNNSLQSVGCYKN